MGFGIRLASHFKTKKMLLVSVYQLYFPLWAIQYQLPITLVGY